MLVLVTPTEMQMEKWSRGALLRVLLPFEAALSGTNGCALDVGTCDLIGDEDGKMV